MKVGELIKLLNGLPHDAKVLVNDNNGGEVYEIEQVDCFDDPSDGVEVIVQVNC